MQSQKYHPPSTRDRTRGHRCEFEIYESCRGRRAFLIPYRDHGPIDSAPSGGLSALQAKAALGRLSSHTVAAAGAETLGYDALGRLTTHANDLGSFTLTYLGQTEQITGRTLSGSSPATAWSYLPNSGDRRLASIDNTGLSSGQYSNFTFTTTPEALISTITEASDASTV